MLQRGIAYLYTTTHHKHPTYMYTDCTNVGLGFAIKGHSGILEVDIFITRMPYAGSCSHLSFIRSAKKKVG